MRSEPHQNARNRKSICHLFVKCPVLSTCFLAILSRSANPLGSEDPKTSRFGRISLLSASALLSLSASPARRIACAAFSATPSRSLIARTVCEGTRCRGAMCSIFASGSANSPIGFGPGSSNPLRSETNLAVRWRNHVHMNRINRHRVERKTLTVGRSSIFTGRCEMASAILDVE